MPGVLITRDGQVQMADLLLGAGTVYPIDKIEGLDTPPVRTADIPKTGLHGVSYGQDLYDKRTIRLTLGIDASMDGLVAPKMADLQRAFTSQDWFSPTSAPEFAWQWYGESRRYLLAWPRRLSAPRDADYSALKLPTVVAEIDALDPRILSTTQQSASISGTITNGGTFGAWPTVTITGTTTNPMQITNGAKTVRINTTLSSGTLVVDFAARTVTKNGADGFIFVDPTTRWFTLAPGANTITYSGGGTAVMAWRDTWI